MAFKLTLLKIFMLLKILKASIFFDLLLNLIGVPSIPSFSPFYPFSNPFISSGCYKLVLKPIEFEYLRVLGVCLGL